MSTTVDSVRLGEDLERARRIFVNRTLRMGSVRAVGFDMDHTLAVYHALAFEQLAFEKAQGKLVARGYPRVLRRFAYDQDFVIRGLIVDKARGNILKMDRHHYVVQAFHGTRKIPAEMRKRLYARRRLRVGQATYQPVDTLFAVPEISLYAQMVDLLDGDHRRPNYRELYEDVRGAVDEAHADGSIKRVIVRDPLRFVEIDRQLPETLQRMRDQGLKLFLLTNSEASYTRLMMDLLLSEQVEGFPHWTDFFELVVVRAGKPAFFASHSALRPLAARALGLRRTRRARFCFTGGGVRALERALGVARDEILYFGDHTYGDIMRSKRCGWRTAMIIRKLEEELSGWDVLRARLQQLGRLERRLDRLGAGRSFLERALEGQVAAPLIRRFLREHRLTGGQRRLGEHLEAWRRQQARLRKEVQRLEGRLEAGSNPHWGSIFRAGRETSHFGNQVEEFACIYTSRVSNFRNYPIDKYFVTVPEFMPHEQV